MFFFDENIGPNIVKGFHEFGEDVTHLLDHFDPGTPDEEWLEFVGKNRMVLITQDRRIRNRPIERQALFIHRVGAFILYGKDLGRWARVKQIVTAWPRIKEFSQQTNPPYAFSVSTAGKSIKRIHLP